MTQTTQQFEVISNTPKLGKNVFVIRPTKDCKLTPKELLEVLDGANGAPFGGTVNQKPDGTVEVTIYTD